MINNKLIVIVFIVNIFSVFAQQSFDRLIHGKVMIDSIPVEGVNVINRVNEKSTITNKEGEFTILAKEDDLLLLTAVQLEINRIVIEKEDLEQDVIVIQMISKVIQLNEVVINKFPNINAVALGIIPKAIRAPTWAERGRYSPPKGLFDAIKIKITGNDPNKEKAILTEKKIRLMGKLEFIFDDNYYVNTLKISKEFIKGFQFFCIEDPEFRKALESKNKAMNKFLVISLIVPLAENFNQSLACE